MNSLRHSFVIVFCLAFSGWVFAQATPQSQTSAVKRIAPQDLLAVKVYDAPEFSRSLRVTAGGDIRLPLVKDRIHVAGLLPAEAEKLIREALSRERLLADPVVSLTISEH